MKRDALIQEFRAGPALLTQALSDLAPWELEAREGVGEWSVRQIIHHLADDGLVRCMRLLRILVESNPQLHGLDEGGFGALLQYDRDVEVSIATFVAVRNFMTGLLESLSENDWHRAGTHEFFGVGFTVETLVQRTLIHTSAHLEQIRRARSRWTSP